MLRSGITISYIWVWNSHFFLAVNKPKINHFFLKSVNKRWNDHIQYNKGGINISSW